jgi:hypothetical protein
MYILIWLKLVQEVHMYALIWVGDFGARGYGLFYGMAQAQKSQTQFNLLMLNAWVNLSPKMYLLTRGQGVQRWSKTWA